MCGIALAPLSALTSRSSLPDFSLSVPYPAENNKTQPVGSVDLHGLYVQEAIEYTERAIKVSGHPG